MAWTYFWFCWNVLNLHLLLQLGWAMQCFWSGLGINKTLGSGWEKIKFWLRTSVLSTQSGLEITARSPYNIQRDQACKWWSSVVPRQKVSCLTLRSSLELRSQAWQASFHTWYAHLIMQNYWYGTWYITTYLTSYLLTFNPGDEALNVVCGIKADSK